MSAAYQRAAQAAVVKLSHALSVAPRSIRIWMQSNNVREATFLLRHSTHFADFVLVMFMQLSNSNKLTTTDVLKMKHSETTTHKVPDEMTFYRDYKSDFLKN